MLAVAALVFGALCFVSPMLLFGVDAYSTLVRVPIMLLGTAALGFGGAALWAAITPEAQGMRALTLAMSMTAALVPPVTGFNIGAFDRIDASGVRTFAIILLFVFLVSVPLLASLLVLNRLARGARMKS